MALLLLVLVLLAVIAWPTGALVQLLPRTTPRILRQQHTRHRVPFRHFAKSKDDNQEEDDKGMKDAFQRLEELKSLDDFPDAPAASKKKADTAFAKAMKELDLQDIVDDVPPPSIENEAEMFKSMASEVESKTEMDIVADVKGDLGIDDDSKIPRFDPTSTNTDKFMDEAFQSALKEVEKQNGPIDTQSLLDDKEMMKEIEAVFEKGSKQLLEGLDDIRQEQLALAKAQSQKNADKSSGQMKEEDERLAAAQKNMEKMLENVSKERNNVEFAIEDLKQAQTAMDGGVDSQLSSLKTGGVIKQASLVGALLFALRTGVETIGILGGDATHLTPALIQGAIALACFAAFIFL